MNEKEAQDVMLGPSKRELLEKALRGILVVYDDAGAEDWDITFSCHTRNDREMFGILTQRRFTSNGERWRA